jgi:succinyl-CoA synthetase beta subunit
MRIHEYQAKELLRTYGVATLPGHVCFSADEAVDAAVRLAGQAWVVKAQLHASQHGGVRIARSIAEVRRHADALLGQTLAGRVVKRLLVEAAVDASAAWYVALAVDRDAQRVALMMSAADTRRETMHKLIVDPRAGLGADEADGAARRAGVPEEALPHARAALQGLYRLYDECDVLVAEIDTLALTADGRIVALDVSLDIDPHALWRHPELAALRDLDQEDPDEVEASQFDLVYIALPGNIGCLVNGAGLAMATMDLIHLDGGAPANFLDVGGDATPEQVTEAFKLMMRKRNLKAVLVNIFGGIMRCDVIAAASSRPYGRST